MAARADSAESPEPRPVPTCGMQPVSRRGRARRRNSRMAPSAQALKQAAVFVAAATFLLTSLVEAQNPPIENPLKRMIIMKTASSRSESRELLLKTVKNKDKTLPPAFDRDYPTYVTCQLFVDSIDSVSDSTMDYTMALMLRMSWDYPELGFSYKDVDFFEVDSNNVNHFWIPDLYFPNEKKASLHKIMAPNKMIRHYSSGNIAFYARLSLSLSCPMDLRKYPFDRQTCSVYLESFGFDQAKVQLQWPNETAVEINEDIKLPQFELLDTNYVRCSGVRAGIGNHSCLQASFVLARNRTYYIMQMYVPTILIVTLSWISFWLNVSSVPGRVSLGVLTVLTMTTQSSNVNASLPRVSYTKAIDVWMVMCLMFVFAALLEFAVVNVLSRRDKMQLNRLFRRQEAMVVKETVVSTEGEVQLREEPPPSAVVVTGASMALFVDQISRLLFPVAFVCFNIGYWTYYIYTPTEHLISDYWT